MNHSELSQIQRQFTPRAAPSLSLKLSSGQKLNRSFAVYCVVVSTITRILPMSLTEMNTEDRHKLTKFRIERLQLFFTSSLPQCLLQIEAGNILTVHCPNPAVVDELLDDLEDLCSHAWLILGIKTISLHLDLEEILLTDIESGRKIDKKALRSGGLN
jgi:hypothetical protein